MSGVSIPELTKAWANNISLPCDLHIEVSSTNDLAKEHAYKTQSPLSLILAQSQTAGRGRGQNRWLNPTAGSCLLSTWLLSLDGPAQHITSPLAGLALYRSVIDAWPNLQWSLKAPNDLYLEHKKVAGLLVESLNKGPSNKLAMGLGFNVTDHPQSIDNATHLTSEQGLGTDLDNSRWLKFLDCLLAEIKQMKQKILEPQICDIDRDQLLTSLNTNPKRSSVILEVSPDGDLITESGKTSWQDL